MILTTQREIQVWTYLKANRKRLRPVVEARCRNDGRLLAAVYPLRDEFWAWHLGERYSPEQWRTEVEIMTEDLALEEDPPAAGDGNASRSPSDAPVDNSARNFPDAMFQLHDPVPLGNSVWYCELGFCCGIRGVAGTISGCCCRSSTGC